jgi:cellulose synthase/poly-beta-1,6-N-acetylglucosamine synthase-like glycosyltransferase
MNADARFMSDLIRVVAVGSDGFGSAASFYLTAIGDILFYSLHALGSLLLRGRTGKLDTSPLPTACAASITDRSLLSVIIPAYNEGEAIMNAVAAALQLDSYVEVVVVDGGSIDGTAEWARKAGARTLVAPSGRAACLNAGAAVAAGDLLLFLHADTILPPGYGQATRQARRSLAWVLFLGSRLPFAYMPTTPFPPFRPQALSNPSVAISAFSLSLYPSLPLLYLIEHGANQRSSLRGIPYGDQSLAMRRETFHALGGFPNHPLLEDLHLVTSAHRRQGRVVTLELEVQSSARRWQRFGVLGNTLRNQCVLLGYAVGVPVPRLAQWYYGGKGRKAY